MYKIRESTEEALRDGISLPKQELLKRFLASKSKQEKYMYLIKLIRSSLPKSVHIPDAYIKKVFYNSDQLPFDPEKFDFEERAVSKGSQVRVYILESRTDQPSLAIKVVRPEKESSHAIELAIRLKTEREKIENLYSSIPDLIPKEHYIVMEDPFMEKREAATIIESFIGGEMIDIFSLTPEELARLSARDAVFREQLLEFVHITLRNEAANGEIMDLFGPKNLIAVNVKDDIFRLILLDPHGQANTKELTGERRDIAREKIIFLRRVLSRIS